MFVCVCVTVYMFLFVSFCMHMGMFARVHVSLMR